MDLNLTKEQQLILLGLIASIIVGFGVIACRQLFPSGPNEQQLIEPQKIDQAFCSFIAVQVCGAVKREGVYRLKSGDRCLEAVKLAGGALASADLSAVNLAEPVKDGEKIVVPAKQVQAYRGAEASDAAGRSTGSKAAAGPININTADEKTLDSLPGVGPSTANAIIEYRRTNGPFLKLEQIMEIPRFGKKKFERIKDLIMI